jgi:glycosyltransferase involved in cell wall biosynthesis
VTQPLITIGITCHNAADTIKRAIDSALAQDWSSLEVLIVDDCSTDGSVRIIEELISREPRARLIVHDRNAGVAVARNTIIENASGEFIAYFDDDDESVPDRVRQQLERIVAYERESGSRLVFCYTNRNVVEIGSDEPSYECLAIGRNPPEPTGPAVADYFLSLGPASNYVWGLCGSCTLMARRESFLAVGLFDGTFRRCAEVDLAIRASFAGASFIAVDRPLITQYKTSGPDKADRKPLSYALKLRKKHRHYLEYRRSFLASCAYAYCDFHNARGEVWRAVACKILAWILSPSLLGPRVRRRIFGKPPELARKVRA